MSKETINNSWRMLVNIVLVALGAVTLAVGPVAFFAPTFFYDSIPGLSLMGPFNLHFVRDVGLAFAASGGCVVVGALNGNRALAIAGALWPCLHALFHFQIWIHRGAPFDFIAAFDFSAVIAPAIAMMTLALRMERAQ